MENKNLLILGAIIIGALLIVGIFVLNNNSPNNVSKEVKKIVEESDKRYGEKEKPKIIEKEGKKYVESGKVLDISISKDGNIKKKGVDAYLDKNIEAIKGKIDVSFDSEQVPIEKAYISFLLTTSAYYNKTKKAVYSIYLYIPVTMDYDTYKKVIDKVISESYQKIVDQCNNETLSGYYGENYKKNCLKDAEFFKRLYSQLITKELFEKAKKLNGPFEIIYYYDNGTENIYLSKYATAGIFGFISTIEPFGKEILDNFATIKELINKKDENKSIEFVKKYYLKFESMYYDNSLKLLNKINKDYVLFKREVENKDFADSIFSNAVNEVENNKTVNEYLNDIINKSNIKKGNNYHIKQIDVKLYVDKNFNVDTFLPKSVVDAKDLDLPSLRKELSKLKIDIINAIKKNPELFNISSDKVDSVKNQINVLYDQIDKQILMPLEEKSLIDNFYTLSSYVGAMFSPSYYDYKGKEIPLKSQMI